jgi:hypothetical protein
MRAVSNPPDASLRSAGSRRFALICVSALKRPEREYRGAQREGTQ